MRHDTDIEDCKRIVVKIGSALLVDGTSGTLNAAWLQALIEDIAAIRTTGKEVLIVSSGAIALGARELDIANPRRRLNEAQAAAAVGQIRLAHAYNEGFAGHDIRIAQMLLTLDDLEDRPRYLNARATVDSLLQMGVVPVINENDSVATTEIRFGDNDRLAARVAQLAGADLLILLSDIDGLYTADPIKDASAQFVDRIERIDQTVEAMAGPAIESGTGSGGMITKIAAARIATDAGCNMVIADGRATHPLRAYLSSGRGTFFAAQTTVAQARKQWIGGMMAPQGAIYVDAGAVKALGEGKSLLAAGITGIEGRFDRADLVQISGPDSQPIAQGLAAYPAQDIEKIMGCKSSDIEGLLGYSGRGAVIHRDDMVVKDPGL